MEIQMFLFSFSFIINFESLSCIPNVKSDSGFMSMIPSLKKIINKKQQQKPCSSNEWGELRQDWKVSLVW